MSLGVAGITPGYWLLHLPSCFFLLVLPPIADGPRQLFLDLSADGVPVLRSWVGRVGMNKTWETWRLFERRIGTKSSQNIYNVTNLHFPWNKWISFTKPPRQKLWTSKLASFAHVFADHEIHSLILWTSSQNPQSPALNLASSINLHLPWWFL